MGLKKSPEEIKNKLTDNKNTLAWKIDPTLESPGEIVWCNESGNFLRCITIKDNKQYGKWNIPSEFDELMASYDADSKKIKYGDNESINIKKENKSDLTDEISDKKLYQIL